MGYQQMESSKGGNSGMTAEKIIPLQSDALRRRAEDVFREKGYQIEGT